MPHDAVGYKTKYRWSDDDKYFGPFLYARDKYNTFSFLFDSGDSDENEGCRLRIQGFGHTVILTLPQYILRPYREKVQAKYWDDATINRLGRDWYWSYDERQFGFSYSNDKGSGIGGGGFLQVFFGCQGTGKEEKRWSCFTPWNNWRHVRHSFYDLRGNHFWTDPKKEKTKPFSIEAWYKAKEECPTRTFTFADFDGQMLSARTRIEERQWEFGTGYFKWLSAFRKPIIRRSLDIEFSGETGKRKGSWKGGTIGCGIDMRPGELHREAFMRYCEEHDMTFKGEGIWTTA